MANTTATTEALNNAGITMSFGYNDKTTFGRSYKWWDENTTRKAHGVLVSEGFDARLVRRNTYGGRNVLRVHVYE